MNTTDWKNELNKVNEKLAKDGYSIQILFDKEDETYSAEISHNDARCKVYDWGYKKEQIGSLIRRTYAYIYETFLLKTYYVSIGYCGANIRTEGNQKYGYNAHMVIPIKCTEDELDVVADALCRGYLADVCTVSLTEKDAWNDYARPYRVYRDCM